MKILMFSGGLDSTYLAWRLLTNNDDSDGVHLHYVSIRNDSEYIWKKEDVATEKIISYFKSHKYNFRYSKSKFEFFGHSQCGWDRDVLIMVAQKLALNSYGHNIEVLMGRNPYDIIQQANQGRTDHVISQKLWEVSIENINNKGYVNKELQLPLVEWGITKDIMMKEMPQELIDLTWSCRTNNDVPCGACHACIERNTAANNLS